jgi:hypothetical protein
MTCMFADERLRLSLRNHADQDLNSCIVLPVGMKPSGVAVKV